MCLASLGANVWIASVWRAWTCGLTPEIRRTAKGSASMNSQSRSLRCHMWSSHGTIMNMAGRAMRTPANTRVSSIWAGPSKTATRKANRPSVKRIAAPQACHNATAACKTGQRGDGLLSALESPPSSIRGSTGDAWQQSPHHSDGWELECDLVGHGSASAFGEGGDATLPNGALLAAKRTICWNKRRVEASAVYG